MISCRSKTLFLILFGLGILAPTLGFANIEVNNVSGVSRYDDSAALTNPIIYGGTAGTTCNAGTGTSTCSNCSSALEACNESRIYGGLTLSITYHLTSSTSTSASPMLGNSTGVIISDASFSVSSATKDTSVTMTISWDSLCQALNESQNCDDDNFSTTIRLGVDLNANSSLDEGSEYGTLQIKVFNPAIAVSANVNTTALCGGGSLVEPYGGICDFAMLPGDEKVYFQPTAEVTSSTSSSSNSINKNLVPGTQIEKVRVFISEVDFASATPGSESTGGIVKDLDISASGEVDEYIDGLENDVVYYFRVGVVDQFYNFFYITSDTAVSDKCPGGTTPDQVDACDYMAMPREVVGLLDPDKLNCFIATASYGSIMDNRVNTFREFRNQFLLPHVWGQKFISTYYNYSPAAAEFIAQRPWLRTLSRAVLWPFWAFAWASLHWGFYWALALAILTLISASLAIPLIFRRRSDFILHVLVLSLLSALAAPEPARAAVEDESESGGSQYIEHPLSKEGLIKIDKERIYFYRVPESEQTKATTVRLGYMELLDLENDQGVPFTDIYPDSSSLVATMAWEWQMWRSSLGKIGLKAGSGIFTSSGNGVFKNNNSPAQENYTFLAFPSTAAAVYRVQFWDKQWVVPYLEGGADLIPFMEWRDDGKKPAFGGSIAAHVSGGVAITLTRIDDSSRARLDEEYGVNSVWLTAELRRYFGLTKFDFTSTVANGGLLVEF